MAPTTLIPEHLRTDITNTLARLRIARTVHDDAEEFVCDRRLNWLLDQVKTDHDKN